MKHSIGIILITSVLTLFVTSCSKQLNVSPKNAVPQSSLGVSDIAQLRTGMYSMMEDVTFGFWFDFDKRGENLKGGPGFSLIDPVSMTASDQDITTMWQNAYKAISVLNFLMASVDDLGSSATAVTLSYKGEALYFRALVYYNLVTRWGGVPLILNATDQAVQRSTETQVWTQIEADLTAARSLIGVYSNNLYASDQAVKALQARVYLATGDDTNATLYADSVINFSNGKFGLATDATSYSTMFTAGNTSKEIIFALANNSTGDPHLFYGAVNDTKATWTYSPATFPYQNLYLDGTTPVVKMSDRRKTAVFSSDATRVIKFPNGKTGQQLAASTNPAATPMIISRMAEMYLIKAEALGATAGAPVLSAYLNDRYDTPPALADLQSLTDAQYEDLIVNEYRREFYVEGHWWYDVKRTGRTDLLTSLAGRTYLLYYPIPQVEKDLAGYTQNLGY